MLHPLVYFTRCILVTTILLPLHGIKMLERVLYMCMNCHLTSIETNITRLSRAVTSFGLV